MTPRRPILPRPAEQREDLPGRENVRTEQAPHVTPVAVEVLVEGQVQGVGYRAFAQRRARDRGLTGYAVNLYDGRVKIRVEGSRDTIEAYLRDLKTGPPLAQVERVAVTAMPYTGQYREFSIRFSEGR